MRVRALAAVVALGAAAWTPGEELSSLPVPPAVAPSDRITFSHKLHKSRAQAECVDCHAAIPTATTAHDSVLPKEALCFDGCHDAENERPNCKMCHEDGDAPSATFASVTRELRFSHRAHVGREIECLTCHPLAATSTRTGDRLVPEMAACGSCHQAELDRLACQKCHESLPALAKRPAGEAVHKAGFFALHGAWAFGSSSLCQQCHEQTFCSDCHARTVAVRASAANPGAVQRRFIHRGDFIGRHALESRAAPAKCASCHGQSYCKGCHDRRTKYRGATSRGRPSPHPTEYVRRGGAAFHGTDARLNIQSCAACHDQGAASNCVSCHRAGGVGVNPHPAGWNRLAKSEEMRRSSACVPCHGGLQGLTRPTGAHR